MTDCTHCTRCKRQLDEQEIWDLGDEVLCQDCWEDHADKAWWAMIREMTEVGIL